ncbi:hypothetical protein [Leisingera sp. JC1]|uniref:hypothetical protein n=1 Tax=Leisingera sp. JC1 TaxID=1855282 RepID=UPI0008031BD4|nr:hypothetical protein [Leisingera sp. JC1]OBY27595.1 hypothetical protein A9D60_15280 [Leisingera sp. JC1]
MEIAITVLGFLLLFGALAFYIFLSEIRKEDTPPPRRSGHESAYGKNSETTHPHMTFGSGSSLD